jgi:hypothetical protein
LQRGGRAGRIENVAAASSARNRPRGTCGSAVRRDHSMRQSVESDGGDAPIPPAVLCGVSARMASRRSGRRAAMHWIMGDSFFFFWLHAVTVVGGKARKFRTGGGGEQTTVNRVMYMDGRIRFNFPTQVCAFISSRDID